METNKTIKFDEFPTDEQPVVTRLQVTYSQQSDSISPVGEDNSITLTYEAIVPSSRTDGLLTTP